MSELVHCQCRRKGSNVNESQASNIFPHLSGSQCYIFYLKFDLLFPLYIESFFYPMALQHKIGNKKMLKFDCNY